MTTLTTLIPAPRTSEDVWLRQLPLLELLSNASVLGDAHSACVALAGIAEADDTRWLAEISATRTGLTSDWEERADGVGRVSAMLVALSDEWSGTLLELLRHCVRRTNSDGDAELSRLLVWRALSA
jgi:hypothetical protein